MTNKQPDSNNLTDQVAETAKLPAPETAPALEAGAPSGEGRAFSIMELDSLIKRYINDIEKLREDIKAQKNIFDDAFNNDVKFKESSDKVKELNRIKAAAKQIILKDQSVLLTAEKIKELKEDLKDMQDALSGYVREYQQLSGANQIEDDAGNIREIVHVVKLVKKSKFRP